MNVIFSIIISLLLSFSFLSCAKSRYLTPISTVRPDSLLQITDEEIRKALESQPQLVKPLNIALYNSGFTKNSYADSLRTLDFVNNVFEISPILVESDNYYLYKRRSWYSYYDIPPPVNVRQLRILAAQGKADLLIVSSIAHSYKQSSNFFAITYVLLLTAFFMPGVNLEVTTDIDLFYIDVRNGFLYATFHDDIITKRNFVTLNYEGIVERIKEKQAQSLLPSMLKDTKQLLSNPELYIKNNEVKKGNYFKIKTNEGK
jgi:hypothetical protein